MLFRSVSQSRYGRAWIERFHSEVYGEGKDGVIVNGFRCRAPRYYDNFIAEYAPYLYDWLEFQRFEKAASRVAEQEPDRLAVREFVARSRALMYARKVG